MNDKRVQQILGASEYGDKSQESSKEGISNIVCKCWHGLDRNPRGKEGRRPV